MGRLTSDYLVHSRLLCDRLASITCSLQRCVASCRNATNSSRVQSDASRFVTVTMLSCAGLPSRRSAIAVIAGNACKFCAAPSRSSYARSSQRVVIVASRGNLKAQRISERLLNAPSKRIASPPFDECILTSSSKALRRLCNIKNPAPTTSARFPNLPLQVLRYITCCCWAGFDDHSGLTPILTFVARTAALDASAPSTPRGACPSNAGNSSQPQRQQSFPWRRVQISLAAFEVGSLAHQPAATSLLIARCTSRRSHRSRCHASFAVAG